MKPGYNVQNYNRIGVTCYASIDRGPHYVRSFLSQEDTIRFCEWLKKQEPFEYRVLDPDYNDDVWVECMFTSYERGYRVIMGNILKGMSEHYRFVAKPLLESNFENDAIFELSFKEFQDYLEEGNAVIKTDPGYINRENPFGNGHYWNGWIYDYEKNIYKVADKKGKTKTLPEALKMYQEYVKYEGRAQFHYLWDKVLRRNNFSKGVPAE